MGRIPPGELLLVGRVARPHGRKGGLRVLSYASSEATFLEAGSVFVGARGEELREYAVVSAVLLKDNVLLALEGIRFRDEVEALRGAEIYIEKDRAPPREEDEYFWHELIGLAVYLDTGKYLGRLYQIISQGGNDIYVIKEGPAEYLIPATHDVIRESDLQAKTMVITELEGLLD
ncbi:MAG: 16S rRNA processing protein RimM, partial [Deltaproteobacteria bacterium]|nr:16S rRNA processing protein RimM [Deltaproteobacteria bacterium]